MSTVLEGQEQPADEFENVAQNIQEHVSVPQDYGQEIGN